MLNTKKPSIAFYLLKELSLLEFVFPELDIMSGVKVIDKKTHKDVFIHTLEVVDNSAKLSKEMKETTEIKEIVSFSRFINRA